MKQIPIYRWNGKGNPRYPHTMGFDLVGHAKVDDHWYGRLVSMGRWLERRWKSGLRYARLSDRGGTAKNVLMHQVITGQKGWDHRDGDGLNNLESNLRPALLSDQAANRRLMCDSTSGEPGVSWHKKSGKWQVRVTKSRKVFWLGAFSSYDEAVQVARSKRKEMHGQFVRR